MDIFGSLVSLVSGYLQARAISKVAGEAGNYVDQYFRLLASIIISSYVTFLSTWGITALALWKSTGIWVGLGVGFATGLVATGCVILNLWTRSPLTKGIPIAVPTNVQNAANNQDVAITERK
jgi:hypothetical protein